MLRAAAVVTGGVMIEVYRLEISRRTDALSFPISPRGNLPRCGAAKSGRTPMTFEAFQLFALPLLLTLQKFVEDCTYKEHPH